MHALEDGADIESLKVGIADHNNQVVARAASLSAERLAYELCADLVKGFRYFCTGDPVKRDKSCLAKSALTKALYELDYLEPPFWLKVRHYQQMEPVWGGSVDAAPNVRCTAAYALAAGVYPRAVAELASMLHDSETSVRLAAAGALGMVEPYAAEIALRVKALSGDAEAGVTGECLSVLLRLQPDESPSFVAGFLSSEDDELRDLAALALGESGSAAAFGYLKNSFDDILLHNDFRVALLRAMALVRQEEAVEFLTSLIAWGDVGTAMTVVDAMAHNRHNKKLAERIQAVVESRGERKVVEVYDELWKNN